MTRLKFLPIVLLVLFFSGLALADYDSEIRDLKQQKEKLNSEIQKLTRQIASTDSLLKADDSRYKKLQARYSEDSERRRAEIDSLNVKIRGVAAQLQEERQKQAHAKNRNDNVAAKRKALRSAMLSICKQLERQVAMTVPWERDARLERIRSLARDIESGSAAEEESFSRIKAVIQQEIKFGDEVAIVNAPLTRKNGELINAQILRIGNQWMVYSDENGTVYGNLVRRASKGKITYEWNENLELWEREIIRYAIDVKLAKKPPQIIAMPVTLSVVGGER
jgi:predicted RNase H-like nuclease (RuvC/YqgF family)